MANPRAVAMTKLREQQEQQDNFNLTIVEDDVPRVIKPEEPAYTSGTAATEAALAAYQRDINKPTEEEITLLNSEFNSQEDNNKYWSSVYTDYAQQHKIAVAENNLVEAARLNAEYTARMDVRDYFDAADACTWDKNCAEGAIDYYADSSEAWTYDELKYNDPFLNSLRRTNGAVNEYGEQKSVDQLMLEFVRDQQYLEYNMLVKGFEAATYDDMSDQQKKDTALQYLTFQKLYGAADEGGIPSNQSWTNIPGALLSDVTNYIGVGGIVKTYQAGKALLGIGKKKVVKKGFDNRMKAILGKRPVLKTTAIGSAYGGTYTGLDKLSDEVILSNSDLQSGVDMGKVLQAGSLGVAIGGSLGFALRGGFQFLANKADIYIAKQKIANPNYDSTSYVKELAKDVTDEKSLKVHLKKIGYSRKEINEELKRYRQWDSRQSIALPGTEKSFDVPVIPKNTEQATFGKSNKDEFKATKSKLTAEEVNAARVAEARAASVVDDTGPATEAVYYPGKTQEEASTILQEVDQGYAPKVVVEKIGVDSSKPVKPLQTKSSTVLKEVESVYSKQVSTASREIDGTTPINPHQGVVLQSKTNDILREIQPVKADSNVNNIEARNSRVLQEKIDNTFTPEEKILVKEGENILDETRIDIETVDIPISFSKLGQRAYDWISHTGGKGATRLMYGADAILIRSGQREMAKAITSAQATTDINVARIAHELNTFAVKNADALGDINQLINRAIPENQAQKDFLAMINTKKMRELKIARDNGIISKTDYARFAQDKSYIPRVWNTQKLITDVGAKEFSDMLNNIWKTQPGKRKDVTNLVKNITGKKELTDAMVEGRFSTEDIKAMFRKKADSELDVKRSSHLEYQRKLPIKAEFERELDDFMAKPIDRWTSFFEDVIRRNEYARRFGKNDERVKKAIEKMRRKGMNRQADDVQEVYFTAVGDPKYSETIKARMDNPRLQQAVAKVNAFQNLKLGLAAIPNATQAFVNGTVMLAKSGSLLTAPFKATSAIVKAIVKTKRGMDAVHSAGVLGEIDLSRIATENMPHARIIEREFKGPLKYLNEPTAFLRAVGFLSVEQMNRRAAAIMAHGHVTSLDARLQKLVMEGKAESFKGKALQKEMRELGIMDPLKGNLTARDYAISGHMFNKYVNFSGESYNLPVNWQKPWFKLMTKFKSFMFYQSRFLKRQVADELFINKNPKPLIGYLVAGGIAGNQAELARALASGNEIEKNRNALELLISGVGNAGGGGLWYDTMQQVATRGPGGAWGAVMGPTFSDIAYTAQDLTNADFEAILKRLTPPPIKGVVYRDN